MPIKKYNESYNKARKDKNAFLNILKKSQTIEEALNSSQMSYEDFFITLSKEDGVFRARFDEIINIKLELSFLDAALKTKSPSILSFALTNRLPEKYNKTKAKESSEGAPPQIIFTEEDNDGK